MRILNAPLDEELLEEKHNKETLMSDALVFPWRYLKISDIIKTIRIPSYTLEIVK